MMTENQFRNDGYKYITDAIADAVSNGSRKAVISGAFEIDRAVRIPSDFTLILRDCHLRMTDGSFDNMFVNEHHGTALGGTAAGRDRNINILGQGRAVLDGGKYNGLSERNYNRDGMPPIWKNNLLLFTNVEGFRIDGLHCNNQRWWALNFIYCADGYIGNIDFCANDIWIDADGREHRGLRHDNGGDVLVKNADGIDLRCGCHDILIENITGFTEDDSVALTGLWRDLEREFSVEGFSTDICSITVRNVRTAAFCTNVRLLNQGGVRLHDILIDGVYDMSRESEHMDRGIFALRIGDEHMYGDRHATAEETYNITARNIRGRGYAVVELAGSIENLTLEGIEAFDGAKLILDKRVEQA